MSFISKIIAKAPGPFIKMLGIKDNSFLEEIHRYVKGLDGLPNTTSDSAKVYKKAFDKIFTQQNMPTKKVYRGFVLMGGLSQGESLCSKEIVLSFTEDKKTAIAIAKQNQEDYGEVEAVGYAIEVEVPAKKVWWYWKLDPVGYEASKEKEWLIQPYGLPFKIIKTFKSEDE